MRDLIAVSLLLLLLIIRCVEASFHEIERKKMQNLPLKLLTRNCFQTRLRIFSRALRSKNRNFSTRPFSLIVKKGFVSNIPPGALQWSGNSYVSDTAQSRHRSTKEAHAKFKYILLRLFILRHRQNRSGLGEHTFLGVNIWMSCFSCKICAPFWSKTRPFLPSI